MKVNYDPRYVKPHRKTWHHPKLLNHPASLHHSTSLYHQPDAYATLSSRLSTMRDIYGPPSDQSLQRSLEVAARRQLKHHSRQVSDMATTEANSVGHLGKKRTEFTRKSYSSPLLEPLNSTDKRLNPEAPHRSKTSFQSFSGPSSDKVSHAYSSQILGPSRPQLSNNNVLYGKIRGEKYVMELKRSRTMGVVDGRKKEEKLSEKNAELRKMIRRAKREAEKAIKNRKIFTIIGPYRALRVALRQRGWVEKLNNSPALGPVPVVVKKWQTESDKETDCLTETIEDLPMKNERFWWEEDGGFYGMMVGCHDNN
ncbi:hypothetical protein LSAT2_019184 [Lamellibrachia satsuma]|nr:hypothetical protein LSAT2_019184 [Lamellibrachia satsuma]